MSSSKTDPVIAIKAEDVSSNFYTNEKYEWRAGTLPEDSSWRTDNANNVIEAGSEKTAYGGNDPKNQVIELEAFRNDASNLYTYVQGVKGEQVDFSFDLSARGNSYAHTPETSTVEVLWQGKVIDTIVPGSTFEWKNHNYSLTSSGLNDKLELRSTTHDSIGAVIDNLSISSTQPIRSTGQPDSVLAEQVSSDAKPLANGWSAGHLAEGSVWATDNKNGIVETGYETTYGGSDANNFVIELEAYKGDASNLYTYFQGNAGDNIRFDFDFSARDYFGGKGSAIEVLWQGKVLETITPGDVFKFEHHTFDLKASGGNDRLEVRSITHDAAGAIIDNISITTADHVQQHAQPVVG
jgi:hypothetical protein